MRNRKYAGKEGCRNGGMLEKRRDKGKEGFMTGWIQESRKAGKEGSGHKLCGT